jgi:hypothetical protein
VRENGYAPWRCHLSHHQHPEYPVITELVAHEVKKGYCLNFYVTLQLCHLVKIGPLGSWC